MRESSMFLMLAMLSSGLGAVWVASAMETHWQQMRGTVIEPRQAFMLRGLGTLAWLVSLCLCCQADHVLMAVLVWVMSIAAASCAVAFTLAWRPTALRWLTAWLRSER